MGSRLQQALRSFCFNSGWKYAVFWKLKHRTRTMFTWEDAYYDGNQSDKKWFNTAAASSIKGPCSHDPLASAVAKMSYQVYSLGEGVVGKVAMSGKHSWIFSDELDSSSSSENNQKIRVPYMNCSFKFLGYLSVEDQCTIYRCALICDHCKWHSDGWQTQFSAGIKTILVVAVIPHGVVQLGSLHKISEDGKLVDHIRNVFSCLQDSLPDCIPSSIKSNNENSCLSDTCTKISDSAFHDSIGKMHGSLLEDEMNLWPQFLSPLGEPVNQSHTFSQIGNFSNKTPRNIMQEIIGPSMSGNEISLPSSSGNIISMPSQEAAMEPLNNEKLDGETIDLRDSGKRPQIMCAPSANNVKIDNPSINHSALLTRGSKMITSDLPLETQHFENLQLPMKFSTHAEMHISPFSFCAGYELYEALGPSFQGQKNNTIWEAGKSVPNMAVDISEGISSYSFLTGNSDVNLIEAVASRAGSHKVNLIFDKIPCNSLGTVSSFDQDTSCSLNSVTCSVESFRGFPCASSSIGSEHFDGAHLKPNRKRARPGESSRPRPRDRQLIQDRIKDLRVLVPCGSKCSIDSLLERTIKHMIFLQSVTKHAEKLDKCLVSKLLDKETRIRRFSCHEQGSSWAVELGDDQKACPIIVENINMNGQMLVELLSKERGQFLKIAEKIRSLGLTILKGISEAHGDQIWMCFVVEGENNRSMHQMDVLWSLRQLLQPKISN